MYPYKLCGHPCKLLEFERTHTHIIIWKVELAEPNTQNLKQVAATQVCGGWTQRLLSPEHGMVADNVFREHQIPFPEHGVMPNDVFLRNPGTTHRARSGPGIVAPGTSGSPGMGQKLIRLVLGMGQQLIHKGTPRGRN